jgi:hypothetical protein
LSIYPKEGITFTREPLRLSYSAMVLTVSEERYSHKDLGSPFSDGKLVRDSHKQTRAEQVEWP